MIYERVTWTGNTVSIFAIMEDYSKSKLVYSNTEDSDIPHECSFEDYEVVTVEECTEININKIDIITEEEAFLEMV